MLPRDIWVKIKAVFFDAEGTIFHIRPSVGDIYAKICQRFGLDISSEKLHESFRKAWEAHLKRRGRTILKPEVCIEEWRKIFLDTVSFHGTLSDPEAAYRTAYETFARRESYELSPGIKDVFSFLKESGKKLAIISNWDERLFTLLRDFDLLKFFDEVLIACEIGISKPDVQIFKLACKKLNVAPSQALMIGDQMNEDILGARQAGLWALRYPGGDFRFLFPINN